MSTSHRLSLSRLAAVTATAFAASALLLAPGHEARADAHWLMGSEEIRLATLKALPRPELEASLKELSPPSLLALSRRSLDRLGNSYRARLVQQERVRGKLQEPQESVVYVQRAPFATRFEVVRGPAAGRKVLYNQSLRPNELMGREPGLLGLAGGVWLDIRGTMVRRDTNHSITEMGLDAMLRQVEQMLSQGSVPAADRLKHEGLDARGNGCFRLERAGSNGYGRLCLDLRSGLPAKAELFDERGLVERFEYSEVQAESLESRFFTPEAAGL